MRMPLKITRFRSLAHYTVSAVIIRDDSGRRISCDENPIRRDVAKVWSLEEAEALAKLVARFLTDHAEKGPDSRERVRAK